jgi:hypothetical protein
MLKDLFRRRGGERLKDLERRIARLERRQRSLQASWLHARHGRSELYAPGRGAPASSFFSQHEEDGRLIGIFLEIGVARRSFVEIGIQDGLECNTACFAFHFGWRGVLLEGDPGYARKARENFAGVPGVTVKESFVTRENAQRVLDEAGADREPDLFSLDIDGNDYWIWEALGDFRPRVVAIEYNNFFGAERAVTIPYRAEFQHRARHPRGYMGASLAALRKLAARKGYALAGGCACNAFFVRREALCGAVGEVPLDKVYEAPPPGERTERIVARLRDMELVEVR